MNATNAMVSVYAEEQLCDYNFAVAHPFGPSRYTSFLERSHQLRLDRHCRVAQPTMAQRAEIEHFHKAEYVERVTEASVTGTGYLDTGDTPAFPGVYEAAARVVGTVLKAVAEFINGETRRAFVPIAGLHHARPEAAARFCVFNHCCVAIETFRQKYSIRRIAYVDIDAHHGDGVYYAFVV
jgi:acetoin utilization protein AcuC